MPSSDQDPAGRTPHDLADRRLSQHLSERHSQHERHYGRNVQERFPPVACLSVHAEEHDIAGLRVGEYPVVSDESVGVEESADTGERHCRVQAFGPGADFGPGEYQLLALHRALGSMYDGHVGPVVVESADRDQREFLPVVADGASQACAQRCGINRPGRHRERSGGRLGWPFTRSGRG